MTVEKRIASTFGLDDEGWARHANPWSGWTRVITTLPLLVAAIWSRAWLGHWSLIPTGVALWWIWFNPRAFGPARDDRAWISKSVLGERLWSNRKEIPVPERHRTIPNILNIASLTGFPLLIWGLVTFQPWPTVLGMVLITGAKLGTSIGWPSSTTTWWTRGRNSAIGDLHPRKPGDQYRPLRLR